MSRIAFQVFIGVSLVAAAAVMGAVIQVRNFDLSNPGCGSMTIATDPVRNNGTRMRSTFEPAAPRVGDETPPAAPIIIEPRTGRGFDFPHLVQTSAFDPIAHVPDFFFSGTAEPGSTVQLTWGDLQMPLGGARADEQGRWEVRTFSYGTLLPLRGAVEVLATATDAAGNRSAPTPVRFTVDVAGEREARAPAPATPSARGPLQPRP